MKGKEELEKLVEVLTERFKEYSSIKDISLQYQEEDEEYYISVGLAKVDSKAQATSAQYNYLAGFKNTSWNANGHIRQASKAAVSACISMVKENPEVDFFFYKY